MATDFQALLVQAGAREPRSRRGRWQCPNCGRVRVSVNLERELFHCFTAGCVFSGNMLTLARTLGYRTDSSEWQERTASTRRRLELEARAEALRHRVYQEVATKFREKMAAYEAVRSRLRETADQGDLLEEGLTIYSNLLHLNAELLLLDVLPPLHLCQFIGGFEDSREKQITEVVSQDGVVADGKFHDLPPVLSPHSSAVIRGVQITEENWRPNISECPREPRFHSGPP